MIVDFFLLFFFYLKLTFVSVYTFCFTKEACLQQAILHFLDYNSAYKGKSSHTQMSSCSIYQQRHRISSGNYCMTTMTFIRPSPYAFLAHFSLSL